ncbi:MAG: hypothetical protein M1822_004065 [Bathelium mastoideum]|nr:MAG: hypothetical protein M1822_004065 [Bathelium mastoideum]
MADMEKTNATEVEKTESPNNANDPSSPSARPHGFSWLLIVVSLISVTFLWGLDGTIVADIQATFVSQFHAIDKLAWNSVAFFLGASATVLSWGQVYGHFNAKWVFITCVTIFEVGSAVCGAAPSESALIVGRAICGVGGAGMYTGVLTLLSLTTSEKERALYMGIPGITWGLGTVLGPIIGGAFALYVTWRWGFYINLCVGAACAPVYVFLIPSIDPRPGSSMRDRLKSIDWLGMILLAGASTALIMGISFGGVVYPWNSGRTIALFVVAFVVTLLFALQQGSSFFTKSPVFPVTCFLPIYFIPLYFQYVRGDSPLKAGVYLLPFIFFMVATVMICGSVVSKTGRWMPWFFYGGALVLIGGALMHTIDERSTAAKVYGYSILIGSGSGAYIQMPFNAAQEFVEPSMIPAAVGLITGAQLVAPAITLSIANSVFLNRAVAQLKPILPPDAPTLQVVSGVGSQYISSLDPAERSKVLHAILQSMSKVYILIITSGALTLVLSSFLVLHSRRAAKAKASMSS